MREALLGIVEAYFSLFGTSKIVLLFLVSVLTMILIDEKRDGNDERRRITPTVFLLSIWAGIAYALTRIIPCKKKLNYILGLLFSATCIAIAGGFIISESAFEASGYYESSIAITILSVILTILYLAVYFMISKQLYTERNDRMIFMMLSIWIHLFGFYTEEAAKISLFLSPVSIGSIVIHGLLPILLWLYLKYEDKIKDYFSEQTLQSDDIENANSDDFEEIEDEWDMKKHKIINIRNMAIAFLALLIVFVAVTYVLNSKINSLYNATVVLENAANTKMSVYELKADDGSVVLTLTVSPDGTAVAVDGGAEENGQESFEFIKDHVDKVNKWYLFGKEPENKGAYDFCVERGLVIDETYVISGIKQIH